MNPRQVIEYYSREDIQKALLQTGKSREVVGVFRKGGFGERPNVILYPNDIISMARNGVVEFHCSLERWSNPMSIRNDNQDSLRVGWDLILDIDGKGWEHSKLAAKLLADELKRHGMRNVYVKYTGGKGFHLGIPWGSMPRRIEFRETKRLYPDLARNMGLYLREQIRENFSDGLLKMNTPEELSETSGKPLGKILTDEGIDPFQVVDVDPVLISPRHLFRMPYSLNSKSFLVSLPIKPSGIMGFGKEDARPEKVKATPDFLIGGSEDEAGALVAEATDWANRQKKRESGRIAREVVFDKAVPPDMFSPCIKNMLDGLPDGRKRSLFILMNFLGCVKWKNPEIENLIFQWNQKNKPPLSESYVRGQIRWHRMRNKQIPPPNCEHKGWYEEMGVCRPDATCGFRNKSVKNPTAYPMRLMGTMAKNKKPAPKTKRKERKGLIIRTGE